MEERLTKRAKDSDMVWFKDTENGNMCLEPCEMNAHHSKMAIKELAKYEDAKEQGRMIIFPCNKGDKIYEFYRECVEDKLEANESPEDIINMRKVRYFEYDGDTAYIYASQSLPVRFFNDDEPFCIPVSEIGKTVFLTYEEAEAKLKEMEEKDV